MAYLAIDLGAGSGRAIAGYIENGKLHLDEVHRFANSTVELGDTLYWNFLSLFSNIKESIRLAVRKGYTIQGIGIDTWGVDFGLIDEAGRLLSMPVCYRDKRTKGTSTSVAKRISVENLFDIAGIQQMEINSLYQIFSLSQCNDRTYTFADKLLFMPDLINYYLTGKCYSEYTISSTSQLLNTKTKQWANCIFDTLHLRLSLMQTVVFPGTPVGELTETIAGETGAANAKVIAVGSHDTASAIGAIPHTNDNGAFLSSGTWSLLGVLNDEPLLTKEAFNSEFTNEGGVNGKILFMRNITGLWLLQCLITEWENESNDKIDYDRLLSEAQAAKPFGGVVNTDDPLFNHPLSMTQAIQEYCLTTHQQVPRSKGELTRCVLESLALKYLIVLTRLKECTHRPIHKLHVAGGGGLNYLLNQFTANALNMEVTVGLTEATAIGNIMQQAIALGEVDNWNAAHKIIADSFRFETFYPENADQWIDFMQTKHSLF